MSDTNSDIIYSNCIIRNDTTVAQNASFNRTLTNIVLDNPTDYYIAIVRFSISHLDLPLMIFEDNKYSLTLNMNGNISRRLINLLPYKLPNIRGDYNNALYNYQQLVDSINSAFAAAYISVGGSNQPPFINFDGVSKLFTIYTSEDDDFNIPYNFVGVLNPTSDYIYFNTPLSLLFENFNYFYMGESTVSGMDRLLMTRQLQSNINLESIDGVNYYKFQQEVPALYAFNQIQRILFTTKTIPIINEYVNIGGENKSTSFVSILTDFIPNADYSKDLSPYLYNPEKYRLIAMNSSNALKDLTFEVKVQYSNTGILDMYLLPGEEISVKFGFFIKSIYNNNF